MAYGHVLNAAKICLQAVNKGPIAALFQLHFNRIYNFHREGNKGKQISNNQLLYTKPNFRSDKVANLQFLLKSLMKNRKHHKKCLLFEINMQNNIIYNVTPTLCSDISFYYEMKLIRQAMVKNSLLIHKKCSDSSVN